MVSVDGNSVEEETQTRQQQAIDNTMEILDGTWLKYIDVGGCTNTK